MEAKKQLRKPENWEDFESLCKKLWGEIWDCKEIKKNGRKGQVQHGVDVYGIPKGEDSYYGIQCKGKDEYTHKQLTKIQIDREINLAQTFKPPLAKFYFATTANKDTDIEEYIRIKDSECRQKNIFEVHLFCWEDIVDLIDENKETHDWYVRSQNFRTKSDVIISFENDKDKISGSVPFFEKYTHFILEAQASSSLFDYTNLRPKPNFDTPLFRGENKSYFRFRLKIKNTGSIPIENPKLVVNPKGNFAEIDDENSGVTFIPQKVPVDIQINKEQKNIFLIPNRNVLALEEEYFSSIICIKPKVEGSKIALHWKFVSNKFSKEGRLDIKIETYLIRKEVESFVPFRQQVRVEKSIEDYFEGK